MAGEQREILCSVSGRVQGVTYRDFVKRHAGNLVLTGRVENMNDGSVRVIAQGSEEKLEKLIEHLWRGPFGSTVARVDVSWREPQEAFREFKTIY